MFIETPVLGQDHGPLQGDRDLGQRQPVAAPAGKIHTQALQFPSVRGQQPRVGRTPVRPDGRVVRRERNRNLRLGQGRRQRQDQGQARQGRGGTPNPAAHPVPRFHPAHQG